MANPQLENGYTRIANEILGAILRTKFNATELKLVLCVLRLTYGWNRKKSYISIRHFRKKTELDPSTISRGLQKLSKRHILRIWREQGKISSYKLNKNWEDWLEKPPADRPCVNRSVHPPQFGHKPPSNRSVHKKTLSKRNIYKRKKSKIFINKGFESFKEILNRKKR